MCGEFEPPDRERHHGAKGVAVSLCSPVSKALLQKEPELLGLAVAIKLLVYQMLSIFKCLKR